MFEHFERYPWVLDLVSYESKQGLVRALDGGLLATAQRQRGGQWATATSGSLSLVRPASAHCLPIRSCDLGRERVPSRRLNDG